MDSRTRLSRADHELPDAGWRLCAGLHHPADTVRPLIRFLEQRIFGAPELSTRRTFLHHLNPDAQLLSIKLSPFFAKLLDEIDDPGTSTDIPAQHGMASPDVMISGISFSEIPQAAGKWVAHAVNQALAENGRFVAYQFRRDVASYTNPIMGGAVSRTLELRNIPPMRVYSWFKTATSRTDGL